MKFREIREKFRIAGWQIIRTKGSHEHWGKDGEIETIAGKDSDDVPKGLLNRFLKRLGEK